MFVVDKKYQKIITKKQWKREILIFLKGLKKKEISLNHYENLSSFLKKKAQQRFGVKMIIRSALFYYKKDIPHNRTKLG